MNDLVRRSQMPHRNDRDTGVDASLQGNLGELNHLLVTSPVEFRIPCGFDHDRKRLDSQTGHDTIEMECKVGCWLGDAVVSQFLFSPFPTDSAMSPVPRRPQRSGQALLEFGIISFLLFTIVIGTLSYGIQLWQAIMLQQAVDSGAIAASRVVLPPNSSFGVALEDPTFRQQVYDPKFLVVTTAEISAAGDFAAYMRDKPVLNRLMSPAYIRDGDLYRYPGALIDYTDFDGVTAEQTVLIPIVEGNAVVRWRFPVEEIIYLHSDNLRYSVHGVDPFVSLPAAEKPDPLPPTGLATLRVNFPHQSSNAIAWQHLDASGNVIPADELGSRAVVQNQVILAGEPTPLSFPSSFTSADSETGLHAPGFALAKSADTSLGPFSGDHGLGRFVAGSVQVRPFRQVMTFQAARLREVFGG